MRSRERADRERQGENGKGTEKDGENRQKRESEEERETKKRSDEEICTCISVTC